MLGHVILRNMGIIKNQKMRLVEECTCIKKAPVSRDGYYLSGLEPASICGIVVRFLADKCSY